MALDEDLIYAILKWRKGVKKSGGIALPDLPNWTHDQVCYHAKLCYERGLIQSFTATMVCDGPFVDWREVRIGALTFSGHVGLKQLHTIWKFS